MKRLTVIEGEKLPSKMELDEFEAANNIRLPPSFKTFILEQNPVSVKERYFHHSGFTYEINGFYPFGDSQELTFQKAFGNLIAFYDRKYVGIADDPGGWEYVVSLKDEDYGRVYFCRMDEELQDALTLLAPSFEEFVNGLTDSEE